MLPSLVIAADWSKDPKKCWMCITQLDANGTYKAQAPSLVPSDFAAWLVSRVVDGDCIVVGLDFPIGLPFEYARLANLSNFTDALRDFGMGHWQQFYEVAATAAEISLYRPFYPNRPGNTQKSHLYEALGTSALYRICDQKTVNRNAAGEIFWTLGAKQVGKAALHGWRTLIQPLLGTMGEKLKLWPFAGELFSLFAPDTLVLAEIYPAEFYHHVGIRLQGLSKRKRLDRLQNAQPMIDFANGIGVSLSSEALGVINDGFGMDRHGEDRFDACVGVLGMLNVVLKNRDEGTPDIPKVRTVEGWILGQAYSG